MEDQDEEQTAYQQILSLSNTVELAVVGSMPLGTVVRVEQSGEFFVAAGTTQPEVKQSLGWNQSNIWLPASALQRMRLAHPEFSDHLKALTLVFNHADSIHKVNETPEQVQFFMRAERLREAGLLQSTSIANVDALIELRSVLGSSYLRAFHLSPARRTKGQLLWP